MYIYMYYVLVQSDLKLCVNTTHTHTHTHTHLSSEIMDDKQQTHEESELVIDDPLEWHLIHEETNCPATENKKYTKLRSMKRKE